MMVKGLTWAWYRSLWLDLVFGGDAVRSPIGFCDSTVRGDFQYQLFHCLYCWLYEPVISRIVRCGIKTIPYHCYRNFWNSLHAKYMDGMEEFDLAIFTDAVRFDYKWEVAWFSSVENVLGAELSFRFCKKILLRVLMGSFSVPVNKLGLYVNCSQWPSSRWAIR